MLLYVHLPVEKALLSWNDAVLSYLNGYINRNPIHSILGLIGIENKIRDYFGITNEELTNARKQVCRNLKAVIESALKDKDATSIKASLVSAGANIHNALVDAARNNDTAYNTYAREEGLFTDGEGNLKSFIAHYHTQLNDIKESLGDENIAAKVVHTFYYAGKK